MSVEPREQESRDLDLKDHLKEVVTDLAEKTSTLVRQEIELLKAELGEKTDLLKEELQNTSIQARQEVDAAKAEISEAGKQAGLGAGLFGAGGFVGLVAFLLLTAALVSGLATVIPVWVSALIFALVYGAVAGALFMRGRSKVKEVEVPIPKRINRLKALLTSSKSRIQHEVSPVPQRTVETVKAAKKDLSQAWQQGIQNPLRRKGPRQ